MSLEEIFIDFRIDIKNMIDKTVEQCWPTYRKPSVCQDRSTAVMKGLKFMDINICIRTLPTETGIFNIVVYVKIRNVEYGITSVNYVLQF